MQFFRSFGMPPKNVKSGCFVSSGVDVSSPSGRLFDRRNFHNKKRCQCVPMAYSHWCNTCQGCDTTKRVLYCEKRWDLKQAAVRGFFIIKKRRRKRVKRVSRQAYRGHECLDGRHVRVVRGALCPTHLSIRDWGLESLSRVEGSGFWGVGFRVGF
jgi:hypothetical protein